MNRFYVLIIILIVIVTGWRVGEQRRWGANLRQGVEEAWQVMVERIPEKSYGSYIMSYRGVRVECPEKVEGCHRLAMARAGDWVQTQTVIEQRQRDGGDSYLVGVVREGEFLQVEWRWWQSYFWVRQIQTLQQDVDSEYKSLFGEPYASLLSGVVLGVQSRLPETLYQALVHTGTMHVVAASGFNIALVAGALTASLVQLFSRRVAVAASLVGVLGYVVLAGGSPAVVRAGIMGSMGLLAILLGKQYAAGWGLIITALIMLILWPWLYTSVSFQLSVAASAGMVWGVGPVSRFISESVNRLIGKRHADAFAQKKEDAVVDQMTVEKAFGAVSGNLEATVAATLVTMPISMVTFGQVAWMAPLVNVLVLWLVPPMMILGGAVALLGLVVPPLATVAALFVWPLMWAFVAVIEWFGSLPFGLVEVSGATWMLGVGWWIVLAAWWAGGETWRR